MGYIYRYSPSFSYKTPMRSLFFIVFVSLFSTAYAYRISGNVEKALQTLLAGDIPTSIQQIKRASATNDVLAQFYLGQCNEYGIEMPKDAEKAFSLYRRAAERGFAPAMKELARCYREGIGVARNEVRAKEWRERYLQRTGVTEFPDLIEIYTQAVNKASTIDTKDKIDIAESANDNQPPSVIINRSYVIQEVKENNITKSETETKTYLSDVDIDIPEINKNSDNIFSLIIANENYQDVDKVPNALNDGEIVAQYCRKVLGIPESNIHLVKDATLNNIKREINLMKQIAEAYEGTASFIVYYAGHGVPDEKANNAYMMPVDGFTADLTTCFSMADFYNIFSEIPTQKTIILIDACFSGSKRGDGMLYAARGVKIKPKSDVVSGNTVVISSTQGDETAYSYDNEKHGLFTYFFLKKLKDCKGDVTLGQLFDYLKDNVVKKSLVINGKSQTPTINAAPDVADKWQNWTLN